MPTVKARQLLLPFLSAGATVLCAQMEWLIEMRTVATIVFSGIFFTFAITIGTANKRRFDALDEMATMKSYILSLGEIFLVYLPKDKCPHAMDELRAFFPVVKNVLTKKSFRLGLSTLQHMDEFFTNLLEYIFMTRENGLGSPEVSRLLQWHQGLHFSFERLLAIKEYNTPITLRRFVFYALFVAIFLLSPEFARMGWLGAVGSFLVATMIIVLSGVQEWIEDPFGYGIDKIHFEFIDRIQERLTHRI